MTVGASTRYAGGAIGGRAVMTFPFSIGNNTGTVSLTLTNIVNNAMYNALTIIRIGKSRA